MISARNLDLFYPIWKTVSTNEKISFFPTREHIVFIPNVKFMGHIEGWIEKYIFNEIEYDAVSNDDQADWVEGGLLLGWWLAQVNCCDGEPDGDDQADDEGDHAVDDVHHADDGDELDCKLLYSPHEANIKNMPKECKFISFLDFSYFVESIAVQLKEGSLTAVKVRFNLN